MPVVVVVSMAVFGEVLVGFGSNDVCHRQMMIVTCGRKFSLMEVLYEESRREPGRMARMEEGMAPIRRGYEASICGGRV